MNPTQYTLPGGDELLSTKELADRLKRHPAYVYAMRRAGFPMPGGRSTLNQALAWLTEHPNFRQKKPNENCDSEERSDYGNASL